MLFSNQQSVGEIKAKAINGFSIRKSQVFMQSFNLNASPANAVRKYEILLADCNGAVCPMTALWIITESISIGYSSQKSSYTDVLDSSAKDLPNL